MNFEQLLASYDPIDSEYKAHFNDTISTDDPIRRKNTDKYFSFIPNKKEVEEILIDPLKRA